MVGIPIGLLSAAPQPSQRQPDSQERRRRGLMGMPAENWFAIANMLGSPQGPQRQQAMMGLANLAHQQRQQQEESSAALASQKNEARRADQLRRALAGGGGIEAALPFMDSEALTELAAEAPTRYSVREGDETVNYESSRLGGTREIGRGPTHRAPNTTNVNLPEGPSKYEERVGEAVGDQVGGMLTDDSIYSQLESARTMTALIEEAGEGGNFYTGPGGNIRTSVARFGEALGIDMSRFQDVPAAEVMRAITNEMASNLRSRLPGPMSDSDRQFLVEMVPGLARTPEGNALLIDLYTRALERQAVFQDAVRAEMAQTGELPSYGRVLQIQNEVREQHGDLFTPQDRTRAMGLTGGAGRNDPRQ